MKFQCDRCKTRYSIADEKVRGKILKIRCKNCSSVITVKGTAEARQVPRDRSRGTGPQASPALSEAFQKAMAKPPTAQMAAAKPPPLPPDDEWYLSVDGSQDGPYTLAQATERVRRRTPGVEMFAWREGFDDWLPVEEVQELRPQVAPAAPAPRAPSIPAPAPRAPSPALRSDTIPEEAPSLAAAAATPAESTFGASSRPATGEAGEPDDGGELDFDVGEASRIVRMPILPPSEVGVARPLAKPSLPGMGSNTNGKSTGGAAALARGTGGAPALAQASALEAPAPPVMTPQAAPRKRSNVLLLAIGGGVAAAVIAAILVVVGMSSDSGDRRSGRAASNQFVSDFYKSGGFPGAQPPRGPGDEAANKGADKGGGARKTARAAGGSQGSRTGPATSVEKTPTGFGGKTDTFSGSDTEQALGPLSPDDVLAAARANQVGIKWCYERALKVNPDLRVTKVEVTITIDRSGRVSAVKVPDQSSALSSCLADKIKRWRFRKSTEEFTGQFPLYFSKRG